MPRPSNQSAGWWPGGVLQVAKENTEAEAVPGGKVLEQEEGATGASRTRSVSVIHRAQESIVFASVLTARGRMTSN